MNNNGLPIEGQPQHNSNISFSSRVKEELRSATLGAECCVVAEMSALLYTISSLSIGEDGELTLLISSRNASAVNRAMTLGDALLGSCLLTKPTTHEYSWTGDQARRILSICGMLGDQGWFALSDVERSSSCAKPCCRAAFLRGSFLGGGSAADPAKEYHLEFVSGDDRLSGIWVDLLEGLRLTPRRVTRKNQHVVYLKEAEQIALLLTVMGAAPSRLAVEDARILKEMRNQVNRATNCDAANLDKAVDAADRHIRAIETVAQFVGLGALPDALRETAEARVNHPELTLAELGRTLNPPVGKSGMNHRLKKIERLASSLSSEKIVHD